MAIDLSGGGGTEEPRVAFRGNDNPLRPEDTLADSNFRRMSALANTANQRQAGTMDAAQLSPELMQMLQARAAGSAPSAAEIQMQQGLDRTLAAQMAAGASQRGGRVGATNRSIAEQANAARLSTAGQTAQLRASEQAQALAQYAGTSTEQARFQQQAAQQNLQAAAQQQQMNDEMTRYYLGLGYSMDEANRQARLKMKEVQEAAATQREGAWLGAGASLLGTLGTVVGAAL